jgi:penicillin-binding protein 2
VIVEVEPQRAYPTSRFAAHLLGYVREASDEQMKQGRYRRGELVGQTGLERLLDEFLRGRDGGERIEVDAMGRPIRLIQQTEPHPGAQVVTTIDRRIQELAEKEMEGKAGAVVVMDPRNGDVLAMVSTPAFPVDAFTGNIDRAAWVKLIQDPAHPMLNRASQAQYPPGSVFKIILMAAGLQEGTITPVDRVACSGSFDYGGRTWKDWKKEGHGSVDLRRGIAQSCDVYFYQQGLKIGGTMIAKYAKAFGFAGPTGFELGSERFGLIPEPKPRKDKKTRPWTGGDTLNMSIGQGAVLVTPMQVARMMSAVANGGVLWKPRLVQRIERPEQGVVFRDPGQVNGHVELSPVVWALIRDGLWEVVNGHGTGGAARIPGLDVAGKTGTAQIIANSKSEKGEDHAWFAAFAPAKDPQAVVVVIVERGGHGGDAAAPIAKKIFNAIFNEKVAMAAVGG